MLVFLWSKVINLFLNNFDVFWLISWKPAKPLVIVKLGWSQMLVLMLISGFSGGCTQNVVFFCRSSPNCSNSFDHKWANSWLLVISLFYYIEEWKSYNEYRGNRVTWIIILYLYRGSAWLRSVATLCQSDGWIHTE